MGTPVKREDWKRNQQIGGDQPMEKIKLKREGLKKGVKDSETHIKEKHKNVWKVPQQK